MRKLAITLILVSIVSLFNVLGVATDDKTVKRAQFYIEEPVYGARPSTEVVVVQNDSLQVSGVKWTGKFDSKGCFVAKQKYSVSFNVTFRDGIDAVFPTNYSFVEFYLNKHKISAALRLEQGKKILVGSSYTVALPDNVVDITKVYTPEQADEIYPPLYAQKNGGDLIINEDLMRELNMLKSRYAPIDQVLDKPELRFSSAQRVLIDYPADQLNMSYSGAAMFSHPNAKEFWLSPEMDVNKFFLAFLGAKGNKEPHFAYGSEGATTWDFTLYVSDKTMPNGIEHADNKFVSRKLLKFRTLLYSGDVYEAFERAGKGEQVGREWCPGHEYTLKLMAPDRQVNNKTCIKTRWYYYSCRYCGKCEYNDKHIFATNELGETATDMSHIHSHVWARIIDPSHYVGENEHGDPVFVNTCINCGCDFRQFERYDAYMTAERYNYMYGANSEVPYEVMAEQRRKAWDSHGINHVLKATVEKPHPNSFAVKKEKMVSAKIDSWAINHVQYASQNDLVDLILLGDDYTRPITARQFCSVAVRMIEKITKMEIPVKSSGRNRKSDDVYVQKAFAASVLDNSTDFDPSATITREQMATYLYRALMYAREHSNMRFTQYESRLADYDDADMISAWAVEPMAFMNALGLVKAKTKTSIAPKDICSIQEVVQVAYHSLSAGDIGWYQCFKAGGMYPFYRNHGPITQTSYAVGDRVWVTAKDEKGWLSVIDPYNGLDTQVPIGDFRPIRVLKDDDAQLYQQCVL